MPKLILIVDDEKVIVDILKYNLEKSGYSIIFSHDGLEALTLAREKDPDLILLDVMLPSMNGFDVCKTLRQEGNNVPIIMLTAREEETDKVLGLELGADDYITKPFSIVELTARVKANMRRARATNDLPGKPLQEDVISLNDLVIDFGLRSVKKNGVELELTLREFELVKYLVENRGKVVSRQELMVQVWQYEYFGDLRMIDVAIRRLREKIEDDPAEPTYILTKRGIGYFFNA